MEIESIDLLDSKPVTGFGRMLEISEEASVILGDLGHFGFSVYLDFNLEFFEE